MKKEIIKIEGVVQNPGTFNHVVKAGGFLFFTSQLSADLRTGKILPGDVTEQTTRAMDNIKFLIESCGGQMDDIVKVVIYMRDTNLRKMINAVYGKYFKPGREPAKISVQASSPVDGIDVEIEATAIAKE